MVERLPEPPRPLGGVGALLRALEGSPVVEPGPILEVPQPARCSSLSPNIAGDPAGHGWTRALQPDHQGANPGSAVPCGTSGWPRVLAVMDEAAGSVRTRVLCGRERSFHRGQFQGACWLAHGVGVA